MTDMHHAVARRSANQQATFLNSPYARVLARYPDRALETGTGDHQGRFLSGELVDQANVVSALAHSSKPAVPDDLDTFVVTDSEQNRETVRRVIESLAADGRATFKDIALRSGIWESGEYASKYGSKMTRFVRGKKLRSISSDEYRKLAAYLAKSGHVGSSDREMAPENRNRDDETLDSTYSALVSCLGVHAEEVAECAPKLIGKYRYVKPSSSRGYFVSGYLTIAFDSSKKLLRTKEETKLETGLTSNAGREVSDGFLLAKNGQYSMLSVARSSRFFQMTRVIDVRFDDDTGQIRSLLGATFGTSVAHAPIEPIYYVRCDDVKAALLDSSLLRESQLPPEILAFLDNDSQGRR